MGGLIALLLLYTSHQLVSSAQRWESAAVEDLLCLRCPLVEQWLGTG